MSSGKKHKKSKNRRKHGYTREQHKHMDKRAHAFANWLSEAARTRTAIATDHKEKAASKKNIRRVV